MAATPGQGVFSSFPFANDFPSLSFNPGRKFQDSVRLCLGAPISHPAFDRDSFLVAAFGCCKFQLSSELLRCFCRPPLVALQLSSLLNNLEIVLSDSLSPQNRLASLSPTFILSVVKRSRSSSFFGVMADQIGNANFANSCRKKKAHGLLLPNKIADPLLTWSGPLLSLMPMPFPWASCIGLSLTRQDDLLMIVLPFQSPTPNHLLSGVGQAPGKFL